jgi:hypothetical protein
MRRPAPRAGEALAATGTIKASTTATIVAISPARVEDRREADAGILCGKLTTRRPKLATFRESIWLPGPEPG